MSAQTLKEHLELETLRALTYRQINKLMNDYHNENSRLENENGRLKKELESYKCSNPQVFSSVGQIILAKDVDIQKDLNGFKKFVVNGKMLQSTSNLFDELNKKL